MSSRGSRVRFDAVIGAGDPAPVPVIGPVVFTLTFGGVAKTVDLSDLPCPKLVRALAAALASIGGDSGTLRTWAPDFQQMVRHLREFVTHVAGHDPAAADDMSLGGLTVAMVDGFEAALVTRFGAAAGRVERFVGTVVRLLRLADERYPEQLRPDVQARLGHSTSAPLRPRSPLDAYPAVVLDAVQAAAVADVQAIAARVERGRVLAATGSDPAVAGWAERANVLWHIAAHGPLRIEQVRGNHTVRCAAGGIGGFNTQLFPGPADPVPFIVALICMTGLEPECAKGLRAGCLSGLSGSFVTLSYGKRRAHTGTAKTMRIKDGGLATPGGLIRLAVRLTGPARARTGGTALWTGVSAAGTLQAFYDGGGYEMTYRIRRWAAARGLQELTDYGGGPVHLDLRRLRKAVKSQRYLATGGVLDDFATGHSRQVAASRYADIGAHREIHDQAVEAGLEQALAVALPPPVVIPAATGGGTPGPTASGPADAPTPTQVHAAGCVDNDVFLASCTGFLDSPFARKPGTPCPVAVWGCLECPNAVFTDRHLPSLVAFAGFLDAQREVLSQADWTARYGLAHQRLTGGIFTAFPSTRLEAARKTAHTDYDAALPARLLEQLT